MQDRYLRVSAFVIGIVNIVFVLGILFLPLFRSNCRVTNGELTCENYISYVELGGTFRGYAFLIAIIALGIGIMLVARVGKLILLRTVCFADLCLTLIAILLESWTFGLFLLPCGVLMLVNVVMIWMKVDRQTSSV